MAIIRRHDHEHVVHYPLNRYSLIKTLDTNWYICHTTRYEAPSTNYKIMTEIRCLVFVLYLIMS